MQHQHQELHRHHQLHLEPPLQQQQLQQIQHLQEQIQNAANAEQEVERNPIVVAAAPPRIPLGESPSYQFASTTIEKFYKFREAPELIARTNHSTVHKVFSETFQREVAVKIIDKRSIPSNLVDKFLPRELEITRAVHHPHIVRALHIIQPHLTKVAIISEFYSGGTLLQYVLKRHQLDEADCARLFRQLSEAVHYLHHTLGVVHRDIKMENILLDKNGDVKLADFGFARYISQAQTSTSFCGTRPYSAPQLVQQKPYDPFAADWYASGVVLFTMLVGKWPHDPKEKYVYPLKYPETIDADARDIIAKLMTPEEATRGGYYEIWNSRWMKKWTNCKWVLTDELFIYEVQSPIL